MTEVADEELVRVESEWDLAAVVASMAMGDSTGGAGVSRSSSPRETTEEAKLETLPVEVRFDRERREKAAAEEAVEVRDDAGALDELAVSAEVESRGSVRDEMALVTKSSSELRRLGTFLAAEENEVGRADDSALSVLPTWSSSSSSGSSRYLASEERCGLKCDVLASSPA